MKERLTRKQFLARAAAAGAAVAVPEALAPAAQARRARRHPRRRSVAILGGGIAGLTAAHELAERGFEVTVYERRALGGKARSIPVPRSAAGGRRLLPGEHGARAVFGWYQNLPDTLQRIPAAVPGQTVFEQLVDVPKIEFARTDGRPALVVPLALNQSGAQAWTAQQTLDALLTFLQEGTRLPPDQLAFFVNRLGVFLSSCDARRLGEWEKVSWWDFIAASRFGEDYGKIFADSITGPLMAARSREKTARATGLAAEGLLYSLLGRENGTVDRVFDAPTNEAWIDAWVRHLRSLGVRFALRHEITGLHYHRGRIVAAELHHAGRRGRAVADHFVLAVPAERAKRLLGRALLRADPQLAAIRELVTHRYHGVQFFMRSPAPIIRGHILYVDSPWKLVSISQAQFWQRNLPRDYGNGAVQDIVSVDIGEFEQPGIVSNAPASELRHPQQIAMEVWAQLQSHLGADVLRSDQLVRWFVDPGLVFRAHGRSFSEDQMFISTPGIWSARPSATTAIANLFLAADYVQVSSDLATMDGANEAARRAVGAVLQAVGAESSAPTVYTPYRPPEWEGLKQLDQQRYSAGEPNVFETAG